MGAGLFLQGSGERTRAKGLRLCWGGFILSVKKGFSLSGLSSLGTGCAWNTGVTMPGSPVHKSCLDVAFGDMFTDALGRVSSWLDSMVFVVISNQNNSIILKQYSEAHYFRKLPGLLCLLSLEPGQHLGHPE